MHTERNRSRSRDRKRRPVARPPGTTGPTACVESRGVVVVEFFRLGQAART